MYISTFVTFQGRPYMLWASGSQGWTVPGMRRVRYYLTSYKLALPDITRVPPATNIALRRRLATEWKMCARDDSEAIQRRSHPPRWTVCSGTTCDCVCGPREAWTEPTIMPTVEPQSNTLICAEEVVAAQAYLEGVTLHDPPNEKHCTQQERHAE